MAKTDTKQQIDIQEDHQNGIRGTLRLSQDVVEVIAGLAAREVTGIHALGKSRLFAFGEDPKRGITAEVGQEQVALDVEIIIDHGADLRQVAKELRQRIAREVDKMAGREVIEVNISVVDIHLPAPPQPEPQPGQPRVV